jgi:putative hydrolase of HD superfamily
MINDAKIEELVDFMYLTGKLKSIPRTGWTQHDIPNPESVADHSFRVAISALFLAKSLGLDENKVVKMAVIHDMAEAVIGDIVTQKGVNPLPNLDSKLSTERAALKNILATMGAEEFLDLFDEYSDKYTPEAQFVHELDKLEMAVQAKEYEISTGKDLSEFYDSADQRIHLPVLRKMLDIIRKKP